MNIKKTEIETKINETIEMLKGVSPGRETALVKTKLDEAKLWLTLTKEIED